MKKRYKIRLPKGMVVKDDAHVDITDDCIYVEAELVKEQKYEPKDGDFVCMPYEPSLVGYKGHNRYIAIFKGIKDGVIYVHSIICAPMGVCEDIGFDMGISPQIKISGIKPATEEEKKMLLEKMGSVGKLWNPEKKTIEETFIIPKVMKYMPKDGDFIFVQFKLTPSHPTNSYIGIYSGISEDSIFANLYSIFWMHAALHLSNGNKLICPTFEISESLVELRPATEKEKKQLLDKLAEEGRKWNAETKEIEEIEKIRWRAEPGCRFYVVDPHGDIDFLSRPTSNVNDDYRFYICGNYFKTHEAAEIVAKQIKEIFKNSKAE